MRHHLRAIGCNGSEAVDVPVFFLRVVVEELQNLPRLRRPAIAMWMVTCRELGVAPSAYLKYVVPRVAAGAVPVLLMLQWCKVFFDVQTFTGLVAAGSAMVVLFAVIWVAFVYRDDPYVDLQAHLGGSRVWRWSRA